MSDWRSLFRIGASIIDQANAVAAGVIDWSFGGGTALMLQIDHRVSHDIDIFVDDPQFLPLLNPETQGYDFDVVPSGYSGDGAGFLKIAFDGIGEIDFIVGAQLTDEPFRETEVEGRIVKLETVPEIITKKIVYRGKNITARDVFDVAAATQDHRDELVRALLSYPDHVTAALAKIDKLNPDFIDEAIRELAISESFRDLAGVARLRAVELLSTIYTVHT
jgi:hypothetical protein